MNELIKELREWKKSISPIDIAAVISGEKWWTGFNEILSRHAAKPVEGDEGYIENMARTLEYLDACGGLGFEKHEMIRKALYRFHHHRKILLDNGGTIDTHPAPNPDKPESLAELADRKVGLGILSITERPSGWRIRINNKYFVEPTYAQAEQAAREFLNTLEDKGTL